MITNRAAGLGPDAYPQVMVCGWARRRRSRRDTRRCLRFQRGQGL